MKILTQQETRHRVIVLSDLENEPDDSQSMIKLLMYCNEFDVEGLIAVTSRWLRHTVYPETITSMVQAYGIVRPNLLKHAQGWPETEVLLHKVAGGQIGFGMEGVGDGINSAGADLIIKAVDKDDPRPVHVAINAGSNTLAQAIWHVSRTRTSDQVAAFIAKIRVYDDSGQDNAGAWMCHEFPELFYVRSRAQVFGLFGPTVTSGPQPWLPLDQWDWVEQNVRIRHGILGALYPQRIFKERLYEFMEGGNTTTWLGLANKGLYDPAQISWGGWGGRMSWEKKQVPAGQHQVDKLELAYTPFMMYPQADDWSWKHDQVETWNAFSGLRGDHPYTINTFAPLWRWRDAYTRDFAGRMDWCINSYEQANHHPVAAFYDDTSRTIVTVKASAGERICLDASKSWDPDQDVLSYQWYVYPEAGTYSGSIMVEQDTESIAYVMVPADGQGKQIHIILEVTDNNPIVPLTSYRRIVIDIAE